MPKTITKEVTLYTFRELVELEKQGQMKRACEKARQWLQEGATDHKWWDSVYEDWNRRLHEAGFYGAQIYFSGFWNQGDGACFDAECSTDDLIKDLDTKFKQLHSEIDVNISIQSNSYATHYSHSKTRYIDIDSYQRNLTKEQEFLMDELGAIIEQKRLDLCRAIYRDLEADYEYRTSDEGLIEDAEANEWLFNESGEMETA